MPLVVCATPIGNLEDVTLRVLAALARPTPFSARTRGARRSCSTATRSAPAALVSFHRHNEARACPSCSRGSLAGETHRARLGRGPPGGPRPGRRLVVAALAAGVPVTVLPGPSAVETALVASGLVTREYRFLGYLPRREAELRALWDEPAAGTRRRRVRVAAAAAARPRGARRAQPGAASRRLPRADEALRGGRARAPLPSSRTGFAEPVKGEVTLVIGRGRRRAARRTRPQSRRCASSSRRARRAA